MGPQPAAPLPSREELTACVERCLHRGGWGNPDVLLVRYRGRHLVVKDFAPRSRVVRETFGRWSIRRERRAYARLAGVESVPRLLGEIDALAFVLEHRPGRALGRSLAPELPAGFLAELQRAVGALHARGVVHLDLRHRGNLLATAEGSPVVIDFASSLCFDPRSRCSRPLLACGAWLDRRALRKWERKLSQARGVSEAVTSGTTSEGSRGASRPT